MKILWLCANFLHPTTKGGQIRTLGILRQLSRRHEVHYVAYEDPEHPEAAPRAVEYSCRAYAFRHAVVDKRSPRFIAQLAAGMFSPVPLAIRRYTAPALKTFVEDLAARERFDRVVIDFLTMAGACPDLGSSVLFQHNVETMIWRRRAERSRAPFRKMYLRLQAGRMYRYERDICRKVRHVIAVSELDAGLMRDMFGISHVSAVPTGVDIEYFDRPAGGASAPSADLVFVGSMDWLPNVDGIGWFVQQVLPHIRRRRPDCRVAIVGRIPPPGIVDLGRRDPGIIVTGTVPDIRPYLWGGTVSIVPLRIGGGTRLKIYEAMAAGIPVVSTRIGAEGLDVHPPDDIRIAGEPAEFAAQCLELLESATAREAVAARAREMVRANFSWETVAAQFADLLERCGEQRAVEAGTAAAR